MLLLAAAPSSLLAQVNHNAPSKYGATFYHWRCVYTGLPAENVYPPTLNWDIREQSWWNTIVQRARNANIGWFAVNSWGQGISSGCPPEPASQADPAFLSELITAIEAADTTTLKLALFDDTTSEVLRKNLAKGRGWHLPGQAQCADNPDCFFDLADANGSGEGGWFYFYDQQWKRFFQAIPDQYRFKIDGRPVVFMWGVPELYRNHHAFSDMILALKAATLADFGFEPYVIVEEEWQDVDPDISAGVVETIYDWFDPFNGTYPYATLTGIGDVQVGHAIPGIDRSKFGENVVVIDRQNGQLYDDGLNDAAFGDIVLIESINNVEENLHLIDTQTWGARELTTTLWYTTNRP